jgi:hypothetical protein
MCEYKYITYLKKNSDLYLGYLEADVNWCNANEQYLKTNYYDLISVDFIEPHTHQYELEKYYIEIKTDIDVETVEIENNYLTHNKYNPYVLVKFTNDKFGYIHTENFNPIEFENQEQIKNKLLDFLLTNNSP